MWGKKWLYLKQLHKFNQYNYTNVDFSQTHEMNPLKDVFVTKGLDQSTKVSFNT